MNTPQRGWSARTLELVPLDTAPARYPVRPVEPAAPVPDAARIRDAYLRARFPGVIRSPADLADADRVVDAVRCYAGDGRLDRARELAGLVLSGQPELQALREVRGGESQIAGEPVRAEPARRHAAQIHRFLLAGGAGRPRDPAPEEEGP